MDPLTPYRAAAAKLLKCNPEDLLAFRWAEDELQYIAIAPSGQKFRYDANQLEAAMAPAPVAAPVPEPPPASNAPTKLLPAAPPARRHRRGES